MIVITSNPYPKCHQYLKEIADGFFEMIFDFKEFRNKIRELCGEEKLGERRKISEALRSSSYLCWDDNEDY